MMAWYWHAHDGGPGLWLWIGWMALFWGGQQATGVYFIRRHPTRADAGPANAGPSAEDVVAERYARGEIDAEEYRQRRVVLQEHQNRG